MTHFMLDATPRRRRRSGGGVSEFVMMQQYRLLRSTWPVVAALVAVIGVAAGEIVVALVGAAVLVAGGLARLAGWSVFVGLEVRQSLTQTHAFVGETIEYHVEITNRKVVPLPGWKCAARSRRHWRPPTRRWSPAASRRWTCSSAPVGCVGMSA